MYLDLHVHTTASDGQYTPSEIISKAKELGLGIDESNIELVDACNAYSKSREQRAEKPFIVPSYEVMVQEMADWMNAHPALYKQYNWKKQ